MQISLAVPPHCTDSPFGQALPNTPRSAMSMPAGTSRNDLATADSKGRCIRVQHVASECATVRLQLGHCGYFGKNMELPGRRSLGPSFRVNEYGLTSGIAFARGMTEDDLANGERGVWRRRAWCREGGLELTESGTHRKRQLVGKEPGSRAG